ncbi:MAG: hypothetical protein Q7K54_03170 [Candidatus Parcubacteria bacterium]|nr:hypothetical protein [Candidatus Parcubacteria bacterium]
MKKRNVLNSPRLAELKKHRRRVFQRKIVLFSLGFLTFFISLFFLYRLPSLNINDIEVKGNKIIETEIIKEVVQTQIGGKYLYFFPKTNIFFYPKNTIKNELQNKFKRLKDINITIQNKKTLQISMTEREALYTWCGDVLPEVNDSEQKCYFLDKDGYIFDEAPYFSGEVYFKFYGLVNVDISTGAYFAPENFQKFITFKRELEGMKLKPVALYVTPLGDIKVLLSKGSTMITNPEIIFKADADFQKVAENLQAALITEPLQTNLKNKYSSLEYIDLRFGNKVYFKFK